MSIHDGVVRRDGLVDDLIAAGVRFIPTADPNWVMLAGAPGCVMPHDGEACERCDWRRTE